MDVNHVVTSLHNQSINSSLDKEGENKVQEKLVDKVSDILVNTTDKIQISDEAILLSRGNGGGTEPPITKEPIGIRAYGNEPPIATTKESVDITADGNGGGTEPPIT